MHDTVVVIPCYNEARRLDVDAFTQYASSSEHVRLLFINDGSTDSTVEVLERMRAACPDSIEDRSLERNSGKAEAVRQGLLIAAERNPAYVAFWDADLSTGLDEIETFRRILMERPDLHMVFGSRVNLLGRKVRRKLIRHYLGRGFATLAAWALRLPIYDTQCGAKMFRCTDEMRRRLAEPFISRWIFDVELLARFVVGRRDTDLPPAEEIIYEQPLRAWYDVEGSNLKLRNFFTVARDFSLIYAKYLRR